MDSGVTRGAVRFGRFGADRLGPSKLPGTLGPSVALGAWMFCVTEGFGLLERSPATELSLGAGAAGMGALLGMAGVRRARLRGRPGYRHVAAAIALVMGGTLAACIHASVRWGGFAAGELARATSLCAFAYVAAAGRRGHIAVAFARVLRLAAYVCAGSILAYAAFGASLPGHEPVVPGDPLAGLHVAPSTIFVAALACEFLMSGRTIGWHRVAIFLAAQAFEGHASLTMTALVLVGVLIALRWREQRGARRRTRRAYALPVVAAAALAAGVLHLTGAIDAFTRSQAFTSRLAISERRLSDLSVHRWAGLGNAGGTSTIARDYRAESESRFTETVRVVDLGYVDLLLRYGILGAVPYLLFWLCSAYSAARRATSWRDLCYPVLTGCFLFVNVVLAVFTTRDGLFVLLCALALSAARGDGREALGAES